MVRMWNSVDGQLIRKLASHDSYVYCVCFHTDGKFLLSGDLSGWIRQWDATTGRKLRRFDATVLHIYFAGPRPPGQNVHYCDVPDISMSSDRRNLVCAVVCIRPGLLWAESSKCWYACLTGTPMNSSASWWSRRETRAFRHVRSLPCHSKWCRRQSVPLIAGRGRLHSGIRPLNLVDSQSRTVRASGSRSAATFLPSILLATFTWTDLQKDGSSVAPKRCGDRSHSEQRW